MTTGTLAAAAVSAAPGTPAWHALFDGAAVGVAQADPYSGALLDVNTRLCAMLGRDAAQLLGRSFLDVTHPEDRGWNWDAFRAMVRGEVPGVTLEKRLLHADGRALWTLMSVHLLRDAEGRPLRTIAVVMDITDRRVAEAALGDSEQRLQLALDASGLGEWELDLEAGVFRGSAQVLDLFDLPRDTPQPLDVAEWRSRLHPDDVESLWAWEAAAAEGRPFQGEYRLLLPGGRERWVAHHARPVPERPGHRRRVIGTLGDITERRHGEQALRQARDELESRVVERTEALERLNAALHNEVAERRAIEEQVRDLLGQLVVAEEEERRRLSRELHDGVGQHLTALSLGLKAACDEQVAPAVLRDRLLRLQAAVRQMEDEIDRLSHELRPPALDDLGLEEALRELVQAWSRAADTPAEFYGHGLLHHLPPPVEATVYRIVQEALTNVRKHADAGRVAVVLERRGALLRAIVEDDGCGFEAEPASPRGPMRRRLGLRGMSERAALVGGQLEIESRPGAGTTIYLSVPLPPLDDLMSRST
ncbi:PAS domain-containing protein [Aquabacterium sp. J223]|uniref:PAS domain-containing protein n=1 Tax=Aquabacterium sp. J223 TaxID=2898431 RepID=UPI0021ADE4AD|nr:PAS domain-containing protein [Aquabacterium sp. J223]UUX95049.1 PAS domain-containing protein [Aquabacterium sp. J223]